ncbi:hypothetical protein [Bradyrhizobium sp. Lot33]
MNSPNHVRQTAGSPTVSLYLPSFLIAAGVVIALGAIACSRMAYVESD